MAEAAQDIRAQISAERERVRVLAETMVDQIRRRLSQRRQTDLVTGIPRTPYQRKRDDLAYNS